MQTHYRTIRLVGGPRDGHEHDVAGLSIGGSPIVWSRMIEFVDSVYVRGDDDVYRFAPNL